MKFRFLFFVLFISIFLGVFLLVPTYSQTGKIVGIVTDASTDEALPGANVVLVGTYLGASTDLDGQFIIIVMI